MGARIIYHPTEGLRVARDVLTSNISSNDAVCAALDVLEQSPLNSDQELVRKWTGYRERLGRTAEQPSIWEETPEPHGLFKLATAFVLLAVMVVLAMIPEAVSGAQILIEGR